MATEEKNPTVIDRGRAIEGLRNRSELRFGEYPRMRIQSVEVGEAIANMLACLVRSDEKLRYALQVGRLSRLPAREGWVGKMTWYLVTDRALLEFSVSATDKDQRCVTNVTRVRRWLLGQIERTEFEETRPPAAQEISCKLTVTFNDDEPVAIESAGIYTSSDAPPPDDVNGYEKANVLRRFTGVLLNVQ
jgi:hypothetical protein